MLEKGTWSIQSPFVPPVKRKAASERMDPKTSVAMTVETFPVCGSGRRSSRRVPWETMISCCRAPEKFPTIACVVAVGGWSVRLYRCIIETLQVYNKQEQRERRIHSSDTKILLHKLTNYSLQEILEIAFRSCLQFTTNV